MENKRHKALAIRKTVVAQALAVAFGAVAFSGGMVTTAFAQSNTTGSIRGQVESAAGATILVESKDTGLKRTLTPDTNGRYQVTSLPTGDYKVSVIRNGKVERSEDVQVTISATTDASFKELQRVEVTGTRSSIDVSNTNLGATFTARELEKLPVGQTVGAVIQLAPGSVSGDARYGGANNAPSIGGASASENAYYINGFPVTNPLTQVGFQSLPFGAISQAQVLSGGYGAEFGRSTGGVVNITSKRGSNNWELGASVQYTPDSLRSKPKDLLYPDGTTYLNSSNSRSDNLTYGGYVGGPLIQDKLYFFFAGEQNQTKEEFVRLSSVDASTDPNNGYVERTLKQPRTFLKLDWDITNDHHLEFTSVREKPRDERQYFGYDYATNSRNNTKGASVAYENYGPTPLAAAQGGDLDILKYTGNLTENLTLTLLYGKTKQNVIQDLSGYNPAQPLITFTSDGRAPGLTYFNPQAVSSNVLTPGANSATKGNRADIEWRINDQHTVRAGLDNMNLSSYSGTLTPGGLNWRYSLTACDASAVGSQGGVTAAALNQYAIKDASGTNCYVARSFEFKAVNPAVVDQSAQYIEDRWQVTDKLLLTLGLRNEQFTNYDDKGKVFVEQKNQLEPRIAAAFDMNGDGSTKLFGSYGRYHLQVPANVAIRGAGASTFLRQYFGYTGVDPITGAPTGLNAVGAKFTPDGETGAAKPDGYAAATDLQSHYQDDIAFGFERAFSKSLNFGAKFTYRELKNTIEDWCDARPFDAWAARNGVGTDFFHGRGQFATTTGDVSQLCHTINPGQTNTFDMDLDGDGKREHIVLSALDMGGGESSRDGAELPKPIRKYMALDLFAEHPFNGTWYGKVNWTISRSEGNTEGQLNSDLGQADPAATQAYDFKEIQEYAYGRLPNDRRHVIKAFGFYRLTNEFSLGGNLLYASGRPIGCLGTYPDQNNGGSGYADGYRYCSPATLGTGTSTVTVPTPRGSVGELPAQTRLDLNLTYKPSFWPGVTAKVDVFNVTNQQVATYIEEQTDQAAPYGTIYGNTAPRSTRLTLQYDKRF